MRSAWVLVVLACGLWLPGQRSAVQAAAIIEDHSSSWGVGTPGVCARSTRGSKQQHPCDLQPEKEGAEHRAGGHPGCRAAAAIVRGAAAAADLHR